MNKVLEHILIPVEDVLFALNDLDYESTGKLRATLSKKSVEKLRISPSSSTEFWYREITKLNEVNES